MYIKINLTVQTDILSNLQEEIKRGVPSTTLCGGSDQRSALDILRTPQGQYNSSHHYK